MAYYNRISKKYYLKVKAKKYNTVKKNVNRKLC